MESTTSNGADNIHEVLAYFGVTETTLSDAEKQYLDEKGFLVLPGFLGQAWLDGLHEAFVRLMEEEGDGAGGEFEQEAGAPRLANLANKGPVFDGLYTSPKLLAAVYHILQTPFKLTSINGRDPEPGAGHQNLHTDWGARKPGEPYRIVNSLWLLDPMTAENGATRLVPGSHRLAERPPQLMEDAAGNHPDEILVEAPAGTVVIFNAHIWHGGTRNANGQHRRVLHTAFIAREYPQQLDQRKFIRPESLDRISPAARYILDV